MLNVTASKVVAAPADRVWELLSDTTRYADWVEGTDEVTRSDGPAAVGVTYDEVNPILGPWKSRTHWEVVEFDAPRRQVHTSGDIPLSSAFKITMEVAPEGDGSRVTLTLAGEPSLGPIGGLFAKLMSGQVGKDNKKSLDNLAALVEREPALR